MSREKYFKAVLRHRSLISGSFNKVISSSIPNFIEVSSNESSATPTFSSFKITAISPTLVLLKQGIPQPKNSPNLVGADDIFE